MTTRGGWVFELPGDHTPPCRKVVGKKSVHLNASSVHNGSLLQLTVFVVVDIVVAVFHVSPFPESRPHGHKAMTQFDRTHEEENDTPTNMPTWRRGGPGSTNVSAKKMMTLLG